jgi:anti-sigma B factor antagonist
MDLDVSSRMIGGDAVVSARGEIDLTSSTTLRSQLLELDRVEADNVVVDLTEVGFIDSTGLSVLVGGADHAHARGRGFGIVAGPQIRELMRITGLSTVMTVHERLEVAVHATDSDPDTDAGTAPAGGPTGAMRP